MLERDTYPKCFDPYLRYAISTEFKAYGLSEEKIKQGKLFFLVEFKKAGQGAGFAAAMNDAKFSVVLGPSYDSTRYATLHTTREAVTEAVYGCPAFAIWEKYVARVQLSLPVVPSALAASRKSMVNRLERGTGSSESLLLGVLDDGCPFAAAQFLKAGAGTRVRAIWDQNQDKKPIMVNDQNGKECRFGQGLSDFKYGLEFRRDSGPPVSPFLERQMGLNEWIEVHSTASGSVDEDGCYADAKFKTLARRQSHGAHVMDVFAGRIPTSSRIGPMASGDRRDPPSWRPDTDSASKADIVFVQFAEDCIRDATGVWLKAYVLDGIRYILSFADPTKTENVIINVSYGPTTGPHDGTAELEAALRALVAEFDGVAKKPKLEIVLAAGNSYRSAGHLFYERGKKKPDHVEWTWRLPPDNPVLCFAEIWMNRRKMAPVSVTLTSPGGIVWTSGSGPTLPYPGASLPPHTGAYAPVVWGSHTVWLLAVESTQAVAEHGDWKIQVSGIPRNATIHAYVARSDANMGARTGARLSYFVDHKWEMTRSAEASCTYADGEFDRTGSLIDRYGTLNGIATAKDPGVHVAGGFIITNGRKSSYSSAGPSRGGPLPQRPGPDSVLPCDESYALQGIRAGGNRSGGVFRLVGTSAAAPQLARHIADPPIPTASNVTTQPDEIAKRGDGNIEPP